MLHNLGWENSKLCQKDQVLKEARQAKKPTKRNLVVVQKDHFKCIWLAKKTTKFKLQKHFLPT